MTTMHVSWYLTHNGFDPRPPLNAGFLPTQVNPNPDVPGGQAYGGTYGGFYRAALCSVTERR